MNISQLSGESDGFVVPSIKGVIDKVWPATEPSPAQQKAGIHRQGFVLKQGSEKVTVTLLKQSMHLSQEEEGKEYVLDSTKDDDGKLRGIEVSHWEKNGEQQTGLDIWGYARMYPLAQEDAPVTPQVTPQVASKPSTVASNGYIARFMRLHHWARFKTGISVYPMAELYEIEAEL